LLQRGRCEGKLLAEEERLKTVRKLSRTTLEILAPDRLDDWERDFATWAGQGPQLAVQEELGPKYFTGARAFETTELPNNILSVAEPLRAGVERGLDATLVAGMFFQVLLEAEGLPGNPRDRTNFVKSAVKNFMVQRLAGQITLSQFFRLMHLIDHDITYYFDRLRGEWLPLAPLQPEKELIREALIDAAPPEPILQNELQEALKAVPLPHQANRKLTPEGLWRFLGETKGQWFRLIDFESHFLLNKKTAWTYLTLLLNHEILQHNEQKANRVRYALNKRFLRQ
jgi:hypothetical protein